MRTVLVALGALALAGCSSGGDGSATSTPARTVTVTETETRTEGAPEAVSIADAVERVLPSVVNVRTETFGGGKGDGSGVVIDRSGIIVTNNHVIEGTTRVNVAFNDGRHRRPLAGTVIGTAPERDLAVIRVRATDLVPLAIGRSSSLRLGDPVIALGFPLGLGGPTVTQGIVSGLDRTVESGDGPRLEGLLQTDAAINPGNSGGALVDRAGRLIGINTAAATLGTAENVGFAIAIDEALPVIAEIRREPPASRAWLGIAIASVESDASAVQLGLDPSVRGVLVTEVYEGGPAARAGVVEGDVIVAAGTRRVGSARRLTEILSRLDPGDNLELELINTSGPRRVRLELARRPSG
ncbi:MAG: trypsin-like peptidase domain-containing protein [Actinobacteria bacterium]|nr:trypsin-like peptidase domain-containing protein [Actinomycetota bacterium]